MGILSVCCRYKTLARVFGEGVSTRIVLLKCLCDQLFFATQQDFSFLLICAYSDSKDFSKAINEASQTFLPTWLMDCSFWPIVNFIGFAMVPYTLQPSYMTLVQFFWQLYLSSVAAKSGDDCSSEETKIRYSIATKALHHIQIEVRYLSLQVHC